MKSAWNLLTPKSRGQPAALDGDCGLAILQHVSVNKRATVEESSKNGSNFEHILPFAASVKVLVHATPLGYPASTHQLQSIHLIDIRMTMQ